MRRFVRVRLCSTRVLSRACSAKVQKNRIIVTLLPKVLFVAKTLTRTEHLSRNPSYSKFSRYRQYNAPRSQARPSVSVTPAVQVRLSGYRALCMSNEARDRAPNRLPTRTTDIVSFSCLSFFYCLTSTIKIAMRTPRECSSFRWARCLRSVPYVGIYVSCSTKQRSVGKLICTEQFSRRADRSTFPGPL